MTCTKEEFDEMKAKIANLENENHFLRQQVEQILDLQLTLEIANERWVAQVNENTTISVELRKLKKGN